MAVIGISPINMAPHKIKPHKMATSTAIDNITFRAALIRRTNIKIIYFLISAFFLTSLCIAIFNRDLLPAKYFYDSGHLTSFFGKFNGFTAGDSFGNTALLYELLLLTGHERIAAILTSLIFNIFVLKCFSVPSRTTFTGMQNIILFCFTCIIGSIYMAQYTKELVVLVIVIFFIMSKTRGQKILWLILALLYARYFRQYWFLVIVFYIYYSILFKISRNFLFFLLGIIAALLFLAILFQVAMGVDLAYYRYSVNDVRTYDQDANTMILPLLPTGNFFLEWANGVVQFFLMFFPFSLLTGNLVYFAFFIVMASIGLRCFFVIRSSIQARKLSLVLQENRCLALFFSLVTIQSIFEPDYGSYIKHLTPILPLVIYAFCSQEKWCPDQRNIRA